MVGEFNVKTERVYTYPWQVTYSLGPAPEFQIVPANSACNVNVHCSPVPNTVRSAIP